MKTLFEGNIMMILGSAQRSRQYNEGKETEPDELESSKLLSLSKHNTVKGESEDERENDDSKTSEYERNLILECKIT